MSDASFSVLDAPVVTITPVDIARTILRRKGFVLMAGLIGACVAYSVSTAIPKKYQAEGSLVVRSQAMTAEETEKAFDSAVVNEAVVTTETQILTSAGLMKRVSDIVTIPPEYLRADSTLEDLDGWVNFLVDQLPDTPRTWVKPALASLTATEEPTEAARAERRAKFIANAVTVVPTKGSSVIIVRATTADPALSSAIVNGLLNLYMQERSSEQSSTATTIEAALRERLRQTEQRIAEGESHLVKMLQRPGAIENSDIPGTMRDLSLLGPQVVQAEADVAKKQAEYRAALTGGTGAGSVGIPSLENLALRRQLTDAQQVLTKLSATMGPAFPLRKAQQDQVDVLRSQIAAEAQQSIEQRRVALAAAQATLASLRAQVDAMRTDRVTEASSTVDLGRQRETLAGLGRVNDALQTRLIDLEARVSNPNARILGLAEIPTQPSFPSKQLFAIAGFVLASMSGAATVLLRNHLRQKRPMALNLARQINAPLLGSVPKFIASRQRALQDRLEAKRSQAAGLGETLQALSLELEDAVKRGDFKCLLVTSAFPSEGKTTITTLLGHFLAATGLRILLIDLDLRTPMVAATIAGKGADLRDSGRMIGPYHLSQSRVGPEDSLHILTPFPDGTDRPDQFLRSEALQDLMDKVRNVYDLVLIDTGAVMAVPDALKVAKLADAILLVAELGRSTDAIMQETLRRLALTRKPICGVVVNKIDSRDNQAGTYSGYEGYADPVSPALIQQIAS